MSRLSRGQVIVELAITLAILMFAVLGLVETGFLLISKAHQDHTTAMLADWVAHHPGEDWATVAEHQLPGCAVTVTTADDVIEAAARCIYGPVVFQDWRFLPISSRESAAVVR